MNKLPLLCILAAVLTLGAGCQQDTAKITRGEFSSVLSAICKEKYQAYITSTPVGDTVWVYLPYTPGRGGNASIKEKGNDLYLDFDISSFNPYRTTEPQELKFVIQKVLGDIRRLLLRSVDPYKFFVLVVTNITSQDVRFEDWYMGHINDVRKYDVGIDFSGEGFNRLVSHSEKVGLTTNDAGQAVPQSYLDLDGRHVNYRDIALKEFIQKQIVWRIYKRFTINYNKIPFDLTRLERQDEVLNIVKTVLMAYKFKEFDKLYLKDSSLTKEKALSLVDVGSLEREAWRLSLDRDIVIKLLNERIKTAGEQPPYYIGCLLGDIAKYRTEEVKRKPSF